MAGGGAVGELLGGLCAGGEGVVSGAVLVELFDGGALGHLSDLEQAAHDQVVVHGVLGDAGVVRVGELQEGVVARAACALVPGQPHFLEVAELREVLGELTLVEPVGQPPHIHDPRVLALLRLARGALCPALLLQFSHRVLAVVLEPADFARSFAGLVAGAAAVIVTGVFASVCKLQRLTRGLRALLSSLHCYGRWCGPHRLDH